MSDSGIIPPNLEIPLALPKAIRAFRRRFESPATNLSNAKPDDYVNIYPDTSTPGSFIDPSSTYLRFDFSVNNNNPFVDYTDFGKGGVLGAITQELRVYNQGSITEEILEYGTAAETYATISGHFEKEISYFMSNRLKNSYQTENHKNFIKPPMCDINGNIMFGPNPFGLGVATDTKCTLYQNIATASLAIMQPGSQYSNAGHILYMVPPANTDSIGYITNADQLGFSQGIANTLHSTMSNKTSPMDWPDLYDTSLSCPVETKYIREFGSINKPQIMANLVNVKCYPIGMRAGTGPYGGAVGEAVGAVSLDTSAANSAVQPIAVSNTYRVCAPILSGIFGVLATKMLVTCLLSPQQMYLQLHLASAHIALKLSADPCRRIPGTVRDYIRNMGSQQGSLYGSNAFVPLDVGGTTDPYNYGPATTVAPGYGTMTIPASAKANAIYNAASAEGRNAYAQMYRKKQPSAVSLTTVTASTAFDFNVGDIVYFGDAKLTRTLASSADNKAFQLSSPLPNGTTVAETSAMVFTPSTTSRPMVSTPQYVLATEPWRFKGGGGAASTAVVTYACENAVFYGTYLPSSVPQSARIFQLSYGSASLATETLAGYTETNGSISYQINNINMCGDQIMLPDEVTANIVKQAAVGGFNVHTNSIRTYVLQPAMNSTTQSIICPLKVSQAKRVFFVFQPTTTRNQSTGFFYNSNCGYNPFANISYSTTDRAKITGYNNLETNTQTLVGVGYSQPLKYEPTLVDSSTMSVQLRIGNEFYPQQPLTNMAEISAEFVKTLDGWSDYSFSSDVFGAITTTTTSTFNTMKKDFFYDCLEGGKFTTAFIPQELLDDQTITANSDMAPLYSYNANLYKDASVDTIQKVPANNAADPLNGYLHLPPRGFCVNGVFTPPSSSFILGFNLSPFPESQGVDSGTYLGNNTITLLMNGAVGMNNPLYSMRIVALVPHRAVLRYAPGGQIIWNY